MQCKKILIWLLLFLISQIQFCGTKNEKEGKIINFHEDKTLEEITTILKTENKLGMLYFRSETCGWCDKLEEEVFSIDSVITFIESNFVPVKCGSEWRKNYPIFGVPHTIIINDKGEVVDRIAGYYPANKFVEKLLFSAMGEINKNYIIKADPNKLANIYHFS